MKEYICDNFSPAFCRHTSWRYIQSNFAADFAALTAKGAWSENSPLAEALWDTLNKFVLKVGAPSGTIAVYKSFRKIAAPYKYICRPSPCGREAINYQLFADAGFPMVKLLGVGETWSFFRLQNAFLITEFAAGFRDGRDFYGQGMLAADEQLRDEFLSANLRELARLNDLGILHRGFTPANLLYKKEADKPIALRWIDIASGRKVSRAGVRRYGAFDLFHLLRYFDLDAAQRRNYLQIYLDARQAPEFTLAELTTSLEKELAAAQQRYHGSFYRRPVGE